MVVDASKITHSPLWRLTASDLFRAWDHSYIHLHVHARAFEPLLHPFTRARARVCLHVHVHVRTFTPIYTCTRARLPPRTRACAHIYPHLHVHARAFASTYTCMCAHLPPFTHARARVLAPKTTQERPLRLKRPSIFNYRLPIHRLIDSSIIDLCNV